jgi:hypothetical protein
MDGWMDRWVCVDYKHGARGSKTTQEGILVHEKRDDVIWVVALWP